MNARIVPHLEEITRRKRPRCSCRRGRVRYVLTIVERGKIMGESEICRDCAEAIGQVVEAVWARIETV